MFATHYHALTREFGRNPRVRLAHMGALVHPPDSQQAITFLYRLMGGACPRSYGLEVPACTACCTASVCSSAGAMSSGTPARSGPHLSLQRKGIWSCRLDQAASMRVQVWRCDAEPHAVSRLPRWQASPSQWWTVLLRPASA